MSVSPFKRQFMFFVLAVVLPSTMLLAFGVVLMQQENELAERRTEEIRSDSAREVADSLLSTLEKAYSNAEPDSGRYSATTPVLLILGEVNAGYASLLHIPVFPATHSSPKLPLIPARTLPPNRSEARDVVLG